MFRYAVVRPRDGLKKSHYQYNALNTKSFRRAPPFPVPAGDYFDPAHGGGGGNELLVPGRGQRPGLGRDAVARPEHDLQRLGPAVRQQLGPRDLVVAGGRHVHVHRDGDGQRGGNGDIQGSFRTPRLLPMLVSAPDH